LLAVAVAVAACPPDSLASGGSIRPPHCLNP
jgi:hypothetical protein